METVSFTCFLQLGERCGKFSSLKDHTPSISSKYLWFQNTQERAATLGYFKMRQLAKVWQSLPQLLHPLFPKHIFRFESALVAATSMRANFLKIISISRFLYSTLELGDPQRGHSHWILILHQHHLRFQNISHLFQTNLHAFCDRSTRSSKFLESSLLAVFWSRSQLFFSTFWAGL